MRTERHEALRMIRQVESERRLQGGIAFPPRAVTAPVKRSLWQRLFNRSKQP
jgi:hypothetical protein